MIKLPVFKKISFHIYATNMYQFKWWEYVGICGGNMWEYVVGILFPSLNEAKKSKISLGILMQM